MTNQTYTEQIKSLEQQLRHLKMKRRSEMRRQLKTLTLDQVGELHHMSRQMVAYHVGKIGRRKRKASHEGISTS